MSYTIGVIADTHGLLRPEAAAVLSGSDVILHAGDIGDQSVLSALKSLAPTFAVRGNTDTGAWSSSLPLKDVLDINGRWFYLIHRIEELDLDPTAAGISAVIFGHTHRPVYYEKDGVLFFNPGDAGPVRYNIAPSVGRIFIIHERLEFEIVPIA